MAKNRSVLRLGSSRPKCAAVVKATAVRELRVVELSVRVDAGGRDHKQMLVALVA